VFIPTTYFKMKIEIILVGKTSENWLREGIDIYLDRLKHYIPVNLTYVTASSLKSPDRIASEEGVSILNKFQPRDYIVLLDERGKEFRSVEMAAFMEKMMLQGINRIVFIVGGAYGVKDEIKKKANLILSVSKMTFTHQMIRLILAEQLYRAMTIVRKESYHHE
jgi:23S rRNA (pseudouridine1915-N3)-methyltransferase